MKRSLADVLVLISQFEELTKNFCITHGSDIDNIKWFLKEGHKSNSLRRGYKKAKEIAEIIRSYHAKEVTNRFEIQ